MAGLEAQFGEHDPGCLDFDLACAFRLELYDDQCRVKQAKLIAYEVSKLFGDGSESDDDMNNPIIANDRYADANTQVW